MDFFEVVKQRQSVRKYTPQLLEADKLNAILQAANCAPSAGNFQSYELYVVRGGEQREALAAAAHAQDFIAQAPVSLVFCMNPSRCEYSPAETFALEDATIACTFSMMAATALGLASCWIGAFDLDKVAAIVRCKKGVTPIAILPIGYADEQPERTARRKLDDLIHWVS